MEQQIMIGITAVASTGTLGLATAWGRAGYVAMRDRAHNRYVVAPLEAALSTVMRGQVKASIPRGMAKDRPPTWGEMVSSLLPARKSEQAAAIFFPPGALLPERARDAVVEVARQHLGAEYDLQWTPGGHAPHADIYLPPQPPEVVKWDVMMERFNPAVPFLGMGSTFEVCWDLELDSPHLGVVGGSGSGKSELIAWVVAQLMRGGAGVIVLDYKASSQGWLQQLVHDGDTGVLYCTEDRELHEAVMGIADIVQHRKAVNKQRQKDKLEAVDWPRVAVVLEERNTLQDRLKAYWREIKQPGMQAMSPAVAALDGVLSMGRTFNVNVILGAQETAQATIGRRSNYGTWLVAGRSQESHFRNVAQIKKPAVSGKPGRFVSIVGGQVEVFQAAYAELDTAKQVKQSARLMAWATDGDGRPNMVEMMKSAEAHSARSEQFIIIPEGFEDAPTRELVTLSEFAERVEVSRSKIDNNKRGDLEFPQEFDNGGPRGAGRYDLQDMTTWWEGRNATAEG